MKVKLLKHIRQRFSVEYYPNTGEYRCVENFGSRVFSLFGHFAQNITHNTLESAVEAIRAVARGMFYKHSRKYKMSQVKTNVWHKK